MKSLREVFIVNGQRRKHDHHATPGRWRLRVLLPVLFVALLLAYLRCAAPGVLYGDGGELQTVALCGGVAHPSGYPTFIMAGQLFGRLLGGDPAHRITVMSAIFGAAAACAFAVVLAAWGLPGPVAASGALVLATSFTFWWASIRTEVYTVALFIFFVCLWLTVRALEVRTLRGSLWAAALMGLTVTGHLTFVPAVAVLWLLVALRRPPGGVRRAAYVLLLFAAFCAGLAPYLYLVWADLAGLPVNYLDYTVEPAAGQYGLSPESFDDPWERIPWLLFGNQSQPRVDTVYPLKLYYGGLQIIVTLFVYQFGPLGAALFGVGIHRLIARSRRFLFVLLSVMGASACLGLAFGIRRMMPVFILPATLAVAVVLSYGLWVLYDLLFTGRRRRLVVRSAISAAVLAAVVCSPHLIRVRWDASESIPVQLKIPVESEPAVDTVIPSLRKHREPYAYGERVLAVIPDSSLVVGKWKRIMVLYYFHFALGARADIALEPYHPEHISRLEHWQCSHDTSSHPFVFLADIPGLTDRLSGLDSLSVGGGEFVYIARGPLEWR